MRSLPAVILLGILRTSILAEEPRGAQADPPDVSITPRFRSPDDRVRDEGAMNILERHADLRVDATLVQIPVVVTLANSGSVVTGLQRENFHVFEGKVEQEIASVLEEDLPLSVGVVFDTSSSMARGKMQHAREAVGAFTKTANPEDEFFAVEFNDRPELVVPWTLDASRIHSKLMLTQPKGSTALLDAVFLALNEMKKAHNPRKALLIISDGGDNNSRHSESEVRNAVRETDVQIYAIGIYDFMERWQPYEEMNGRWLLQELTSYTGGWHFGIDNLADLPIVAAKIERELRNQYVISYRPKNNRRDGKYRKVDVKLAKTNVLGTLRLQFRSGYRAPTN